MGPCWERASRGQGSGKLDLLLADGPKYFKIVTEEFPRLSRLRIWCCHCGGSGCCHGEGSVPGLGTFHTLQVQPGKKKIVRELKRRGVGQGVY